MPRRVGKGVLAGTPRVGLEAEMVWYMPEQVDFDKFMLGLKMHLQSDAKTKVEEIAGNSTYKINVADVEGTVDTLLETIPPLLQTENGDITSMSAHSLIVLKKRIKTQLTIDTAMWTKVMTRTMSIPFFENKYWTNVKEFTDFKLKANYIHDRATIAKSKELLELWHSQIRVTPTSLVSLNNAVLMYVTHIERLKNAISYLFFMLGILSATQIFAKIQEVWEYEKQHRGTLTIRLMQKEPQAWMRVQDSETDPRSRFEELPDDAATNASDERQPSRISHLENPPTPNEQGVSVPARTQEPDSKKEGFTDDKDTAGGQADKARVTIPRESKTTAPEQDVPTPPATETPNRRQAMLRALRDHDQGHDPSGPYVC